MDDELIPVMLNVRPSDGAVSVMMLLDTPIGTALVEGDSYKTIGQVQEETWQEKNPRTGNMRKMKGYAWWYDEAEFGQESGREMTKAAAVAAVLEAGGYREAPKNAANPGLFR